jgi:hypothetical protein
MGLLKLINSTHLNHQSQKPVDFFLSKWYLDYIGENGETMIFYAAELNWFHRKVCYSSWLSYDLNSGTSLKSTFRNVSFPVVMNNTILWSCPKFGISGKWKPLEKMLQARIFESEDGNVDWICYQPASEVHLRVKDKDMAGKGYVERLVLTVPPWKIPCDELRWGRFASGDISIVWTEIRGNETLQWVWFKGEQTGEGVITDEYISLPDKNLILNLDRAEELEADKKILSVVRKLIRYIPGIKESVPLNFLMADTCKWLSRGILVGSNNKSEGMAIHELVNFRAR